MTTLRKSVALVIGTLAKRPRQWTLLDQGSYPDGLPHFD